MEEFQEADVLWPWPDTPPPSPEEGYLPAPELYEYDAAAAAGFSCEPFSEPPAASSSSSLTLSALWSDWSSSDGLFLSGPSTVSAGLELDAATEEFLEADVLWPDTADEAEDDAAGSWWRRCRRIEEAAAAAAAACGDGARERWRPLVSSPIDIPTRVTAAARRRTAAVLAHHRR